MDNEQRSEITKMLASFIKKASGKGATAEEIRILPEVVKVLMDWESRHAAIVTGERPIGSFDLPPADFFE